MHEIGHSLGLMHPDQAAPYGNDLAWRRQVTPILTMAKLTTAILATYTHCGSTHYGVEAAGHDLVSG